MTFPENLKVICRESPQTVVFAEANDERIIRAARILVDNELARPVLLGGAYEIRDKASKINVITKDIKIANPNHGRETQPYINQVINKSIGKKVSRFEAERILKNPIVQSIFRLKSRQCDIAFAGTESNIASVVSHGLKWAGVDKKYKRISSFYLMISADEKKISAYADCSVNISPSPVQLAEIALKTATNFQLITGRKPRVAFLSFSTKGSANHYSVDIIREAVDIFKEEASGITCDGELQFDAAIDLKVAQKKAPNSSLNGNTNVFIFPSLNAANIAQKIAVQIAGYTAIGPMVQGLNNHLHYLPKSCTVGEILNSVLLASFMKIKTS